MQNSNSKNSNNSDEYDLDKLPESIKVQIDKIVGANLDKKATKKQISEIIEKFNQNSELAKIFIEHIDPSLLKGFSPTVQMEIAISLFESHKELFEKLSSDLKNSSEFINNLTKAFVKKGKTVVELDNFIRQNYSQKAQEKIFKENDIADLYKKIKEEVKEFKNKQENLLQNIKKDSPELYEFIFIQQIYITDKEGNILLNPEFIENLNYRISLDNNFDLDNFLDNLFKYFAHNKHINKLKAIIKTELKDIPSVKSVLEKKEEEKLKLKKQEDKNTSENNSNKKEKKDKDNDTESNNYNKEVSGKNGGLDFGSGIYVGESFFEYKGDKVKMPVSILRGLNDKNISDFLDFYKTLKSLKLNFLWDKYSAEFLTVLSNHNIDLRGAIRTGIKDSTILSILNFLGKNIGIIGKVKEKTLVINENGDEESKEKIAAPFKDLQMAKNEFLKIKAENKINGKDYSSDMYSPVEEYMIKHHLINPEVPYLNITKFK